MPSRGLFVFVLNLVFLSSIKVWGYPEMIRHNYTSCTACHFSPAGGGLLTAYGRSISNEVLSTWGSEKEARPFYGALDNEKLNSWLQVGGNIRALQSHYESEKVVQGRTIPMQAGIDLAAQISKWTFSFFFGKLNQDWKVEPEFVRYYALYQLSDVTALRFGRFTPIFGLNIPQHTFATRGPLGLGHSSERDTLEATWTQEKWGAALSGSKSVLTTFQPEVESSISAQFNYNLFDNHRVGVSYWLGAQESQHREMYSVHANLGFTEKFYVLTETAFQFKRPHGEASQDGIFHFTKFGYEIFKGFHFQFVEEYLQSDFSKSESVVENLGPGFLFYPRPHFEFETLYTKKRIASRGDAFEDYAYLLVHYYF